MNTKYDSDCPLQQKLLKLLEGVFTIVGWSSLKAALIGYDAGVEDERKRIMEALHRELGNRLPHQKRFFLFEIERIVNSKFPLVVVGNSSDPFSARACNNCGQVTTRSAGLCYTCSNPQLSLHGVHSQPLHGWETAGGFDPAIGSEATVYNVVVPDETSDQMLEALKKKYEQVHGKTFNIQRVSDYKREKNESAEAPQ